MIIIGLWWLNYNLRSKTINITDLKNSDGNDLDLSNPEDLVFDKRPIYHDHEGFTFNVTVEGTQIKFTRTCRNRIYNLSRRFLFRLYLKSQEEVPPFGTFYTYHGLDHEQAPAETVEAYVDQSVKIIKGCAFHNCRKMRKCIMEDTVDVIQHKAFYDCFSLRTLRLSQILKRIKGQGVFYRCEALVILVLPDSLTDIDRGAIWSCPNMKILALPHSYNRNIYHDCIELDNARPPNMSRHQWLKHRFRNLPLHQTCYNINVSCHDILQCIQLHPHSTTQQDYAGMTALHIVSMLAQAGHTDVQAVFHTLYEANPVALFMQDIYGCSPLGYLCQQEGNMSEIVDMIQELCVHCVNNNTSDGNGKVGLKRKRNNSEEDK